MHIQCIISVSCCIKISVWGLNMDITLFSIFWTEIITQNSIYSFGVPWCPVWMFACSRNTNHTKPLVGEPWTMSSSGYQGCRCVLHYIIILMHYIRSWSLVTTTYVLSLNLQNTHSVWLHVSAWHVAFTIMGVTIFPDLQALSWFLHAPENVISQLTRSQSWQIFHCYNFVAAQIVPATLRIARLSSLQMGRSAEAEISTWGEGMLKSSGWIRGFQHPLWSINHHLRLHLVHMTVEKLLPFIVSMAVSPKSWSRISLHMWDKHKPLP